MAGMSRYSNNDIRAPKLVFTYDGGAECYAGTPSAADSEKPVLVFVPGLGKNAAFFFEHNPMYKNALTSGFRAACVSFAKKGTPPHDMWENGKLLAKMLPDICGYFKAKRVVVVAHSKGGVDAQTAAVYFGAAKYIESIITLSTPHWGSQLADIAYSTAGWPFAQLIKAHSPGCFAMQTGFMREYRGLTDKNVKNTTSVRTFAGNGGAAELSRLHAGSLFLDRYGENDGVVTVDSAHNPTGEHLGTLHLNHAQMGDGKYIYKFLEPVLLGKAEAPAIAASARPYSEPPAHILRGGSLKNGAHESFYVDSAAKSFSVTVSLAGDGQRRFILQAPDGKRQALLAKRGQNGVTILFSGDKKPQVGMWKLFSPAGKGAYCALVTLEGENVVSACRESKGDVDARLRILRTHADGYDLVGDYSFKKGMEPQDALKFKHGMYNCELDLCGEFADGSKFERSIIRPFSAGLDLRKFY